MMTKKNVLWCFAVLFGILTLVFYFTSIKELDRDSARYLGVSAVANVQGTVFAGACAVLCGINVVGALIIGSLEEFSAQNNRGRIDAGEVARAIRQNEAEQKKKEIEEKRANEEAEAVAAEKQKQFEELKDIIASGENASDEYGWLYDQADPSFVHCPKCDFRATTDYMKYRNSCPQCGCVHEKMTAKK